MTKLPLATLLCFSILGACDQLERDAYGKFAVQPSPELCTVAAKIPCGEMKISQNQDFSLSVHFDKEFSSPIIADLSQSDNPSEIVHDKIPRPDWNTTIVEFSSAELMKLHPGSARIYLSTYSLDADQNKKDFRSYVLQVYLNPPSPLAPSS